MLATDLPQLRTIGHCRNHQSCFEYTAIILSLLLREKCPKTDQKKLRILTLFKQCTIVAQLITIRESITLMVQYLSDLLFMYHRGVFRTLSNI